jgi:hypothetical protein
MTGYRRGSVTQLRCAHFRFALWAVLHDRPPEIHQIMDRFGVSYETARHWRLDWIDTRLAAAHASGSSNGH